MRNNAKPYNKYDQKDPHEDEFIAYLELRKELMPDAIFTRSDVRYAVPKMDYIRMNIVLFHWTVCHWLHAYGPLMNGRYPDPHRYYKFNSFTEEEKEKIYATIPDNLKARMKARISEDW